MLQHPARRAMVLGGLALVACAHRKQASAVDVRLAALEAQLQGGRLGVAALDTATRRRFGWRVDERFAMASTFKLALAAAILERVEVGELTLSDPIPYTDADLLAYAPITRTHVGEGALPLEALCAAAVTMSDNTAANLLLARCGGPSGLTAFLRRHGDAVSRLDRIEPELNENLPGDPRDTTSPAAMVSTMHRLLLGDTLSPASRERLAGWMVESPRGLARLRAGLPIDWRGGDKAGNGSNGAANDLCIAWPPGRAAILVASYTTQGDAPTDVRDAVHVEVGRLVAATFA
jgi:beta-lactamase class A